MSQSGLPDLPEYTSPPVIEVVCGLSFDSIEPLLAPHLGQLWEKFKPEYSGCRELPPLTTVIERFEDTTVSHPPPEITEVPPLPRIWFVHSDGRALVQVQRDRFVFNWRKRDATDQYPRYDKVLEQFKGCLLRFESFLQETQLGPPIPRQYELTYVNHIETGQSWSSLRDIGRVFPDYVWRVQDARFLPEPEAVNYRAAFLLPDRLGRLRVAIQTMKRRPGKEQFLVLELTARGMAHDPSRRSMWGWFDLAHEWIVRAFADLMSEEVQKDVWGRKP